MSLTYGPLLDSCVAEIDYTLKLLESYQFEREIEDMGSMGGPHDVLINGGR